MTARRRRNLCGAAVTQVTFGAGGASSRHSDSRDGPTRLAAREPGASAGCVRTEHPAGAARIQSQPVARGPGSQPVARGPGFLLVARGPGFLLVARGPEFLLA